MKEISGMFCKKCGKELSEDRIFCTGCGMQTNIPNRLKENHDSSQAQRSKSQLTYQTAPIAVAGDKELIQESVDLGATHEISEDSNNEVVECTEGSEEETPSEQYPVKDVDAEKKKPGAFSRLGSKVKNIFASSGNRQPEKPVVEAEEDPVYDADAGKSEDEFSPNEKTHFDSGVSVADIEKAEDVESVSVGNADDSIIYDENAAISSSDINAGLTVSDYAGPEMEIVAPEDVYEYQKQVNLLNVYLRQARETWFRSAVSLVNRISEESGNEITVANSKLGGGGEMAMKACQFVLSGMWIDEKSYMEKKMISRFMMGYFDSMNHNLNDVMQFNDMLKSYTGKKNFMTSVANQISKYIAGKGSALIETMIIVQIIPELVAYTNIAVSEAFDDMQGANEQIEILKKYERKLYYEFRNLGSGNAV